MISFFSLLQSESCRQFTERFHIKYFKIYNMKKLYDPKNGKY